MCHWRRVEGVGGCDRPPPLLKKSFKFVQIALDFFQNMPFAHSKPKIDPPLKVSRYTPVCSLRFFFIRNLGMGLGPKVS